MYPLAEPKVQKKRFLTPEQRMVLKEKVIKWLKAGRSERITRRVPLQVLPVTPKEGSHIRITEADEEKTAFHSNKGVLCYTHMPKGLKNSVPTNQRMMHKKQATSPVHYVSRPLQGIKICYTPTEKVVLALVYTTRGLRKVFRTYANKVVTNDPMEQTLRNLGISGWQALWAIELKKYQISYIPNELAEGKVVKEFLAEEEQAPRENSYALRLNFQASEADMDYEAFMAGLAVAAGRQITNLHVFINSKLIVPNHPPSKCFEPKGRGINWAGNHLVRMLKPGSAVGIKTMPGAGSKDSGEARGWTISDKQWEMEKAIPKKAMSRNLGRMWEDQSGRN
nr:hypothetical protein [Tanacetum cinerariifolium]